MLIRKNIVLLVFPGFVSALLALVFYGYGSFHRDLGFLSETLVSRIFGGAFRCIFHMDEEHLLSNIKGFMLFGTYAVFCNKKYALYLFLAAVLLPGILIDAFPSNPMPGIGFSTVVFASIGFSLVFFLCVYYQKVAAYYFPVLLFKVGLTIYFLDFYFDGGFWSLLGPNLLTEETSVGWYDHLIGFLLGISFAASALRETTARTSVATLPVPAATLPIDERQISPGMSIRTNILSKIPAVLQELKMKKWAKPSFPQIQIGPEEGRQVLLYVGVFIISLILMLLLFE